MTLENFILKHLRRIGQKNFKIFGTKVSLCQYTELINQKLIQNYLIRNYIKPYLNNELVHFEIKPKKDIGTDKIIWQYWGQGIDENTPQIVKTCFNSVKKYKGEYKQIILTNDTISEYIDIPNFVYNKFNDGYINCTSFSDILRFCLLITYGGVWVDATIYLTDKINENILNNSFFSFQRCKTAIYKNKFNNLNPEYFNWSKFWKVNWLSSFIISEKNNPLIIAMLDIILNYHQNEKGVKHYFIIHLIFDYLVKNTKYKKFNCQIYDDTLPHLIALFANSPYTGTLWNNIISKSSIHKLTYFKEISYNSLIEHILKVDENGKE